MAPLQSFGPPVWMREVDDGDYLLNQGGDDNFEDSLGISIADFLMWLIEKIYQEYTDSYQQGLAYALVIHYGSVSVDNHNEWINEDLLTRLENGDFGNIDFLLQELNSSLPEGVEMEIPNDPIDIEEWSEAVANQESDDELNETLSP